MQKIISKLQDLMLLLVEKKSLAKIKSKIEINKTCSRSFIKTTIKKINLPLIAPNFLKQKSS